MRVDDIITTQLDEAGIGTGLKRLAQAGSLAASVGIGATGYNLARDYGTAQSATTAQPQPATSQTIQAEPSRTPAAMKPSNWTPTSQIKTRPEPRPQSQATRGEDIHPAFPEQLLKQKEVEPDVRVQTFIDVILPYIKAENARILETRNKLMSIMNRAREQRPVSRAEIESVRELYSQYGVDNLKDLIKHVDAIPVSLALAQGALESGWGSDYLARQGNAFYGQKSWRKTGGVEGPYGERYRAFDSPADSVRAYMTNLNSHRAYSDFREARAEIRKSGKSPTGLDLAPYLTKYSTLGQGYVKKVSGLIKGRQLGKYDQ